MVFSSLLFVFCFLPFVLLLNKLLPASWRNYFLLIVSLTFYAIGEEELVLVMVCSIIVNYIAGILINRYRHSKSGKFYLGLAIGLNLGTLIYFKYTNFIFDQFAFKIENIHLPIGISFFTFQSISYLVDVYRVPSLYQKNPFKLGLYISLFPQLIAGPIVRYADIAKEITSRTESAELFKSGVLRFVTGLAKKLLIANTLASIADTAFYMPAEELPLSMAWLGIICYTLQIYFDFSGYSDMAIGLGRMFGFHFLENFNYPYISKSIQEFWRRWHISLSSWFRDYVYIPLGGNRLGERRTYLNLISVFLLTGIWHGASWNFIVWGLWHGAFILIEKSSNFPISNAALKSVLSRVYLLLVVMIGWVFFRAEDLSYALVYIKHLIWYSSENTNYYALYHVNAKSILVLILAIIISTPIKRILLRKLDTNTFFVNYKAFVLPFYVGVLMILCTIEMASNSFNPFIYFRF